MRTLLIALMMSAVALAGCSEDGAKAKECTEDCGPMVDPDDVESGKGVIRGVIVDETIMPIAGATIHLTGHASTAESDGNGAFVFINLEPATYFLEVSKPGFRGVQQAVSVEAGVLEPDVVKVLMQADPQSLPHAAFLGFQGYVGCAAQAARFVERNLCAAAGDPDEGQILSFGTDQVPEVLQVELAWEFTQLFGERLSIIEYVDGDDGWSRVGNVWGTSPLTCRVTLDAVCDNGDGTGGGGKGLGETGFKGDVEMRVYANCFQTCVPGTAWGLGVVLQQDYEQFGSAFFNFVPPEDWTFLENGRLDP